MSDAPASPKAGRLATPGWFDGRLVLGVLLVLVSVVVGARVLAAGDRTTAVWTAARDLAPGTTLTADDLHTTRVRLFDTGSRYLAAPDRGFVGYVLDRPVAAGELVPVAALKPPSSQDLRSVSVPVLPGRYPADLARGERVDVWATPNGNGVSAASGGTAAGTAATASPAPGAPASATADTRRVLAAVPVQAPPSSGGALSAGSAERAVVLSVPADDVAALVDAMAHSRIDLVRVPAGTGGTGGPG